MKKILLLSLALMCTTVVVSGQPRTGQSAKPKTQKTETVRRRAVTLPGSQPNGLFSPAIVAGELVFTSGQIGIDPRTGQIVQGGIAEQTELVFRNLTTVLEAAGSSTEHILKATVFLADMGDYNAMNDLYRTHFKGDPPARTTVQVARLPRDARIEIEVVAIIKKD
jgi:2-iminobutanoate/2-iminopropanoate deaminase